MPGLFSKDELAVVERLTLGKRLTEEDKELLPGLREKLGAGTQADIADQFLLLTGWTNKPTEYPA
ncbi:MAG TPA: hypothetical protein VNN25_28455 [Thermoanaerobaculia bacterium]|nr:hypothetical protein [Thermoanaerobaculia bacterium]